MDFVRRQVQQKVKEAGSSDPVRSVARVQDSGAIARPKKPVILVVDDEAACARALSLRLKLAGFRSSFAVSGDEAVRAVQSSHVDAMVCDLRMPGSSGLEVLRRVRKDYPWLAFLLLTELDDANIGARAIRDGADDYVIKPVHPADVLRNLRRALQRKRVERESLQRQETPVRERNAQLRSLLGAAENHEHLLLARDAGLERKDGETAGHARRVCRYSLEIAYRLGCSEAELETLRRGALLHDIGKLSIPEAILLKPGKLNSEEWIVMQGHAQIGYELLGGFPFLEDAAELVLSHHERYDGSGYPRRLQGQQIPLNARIFAVADAFDAMTTPRPYQPVLPMLQAIEEIAAQAGRQFDPQVVRAFFGISMETLREIHREDQKGKPDEALGERQRGTPDGVSRAATP
jgi:cyclic di-GMP phosphodiesterase